MWSANSQSQRAIRSFRLVDGNCAGSAQRALSTSALAAVNANMRPLSTKDQAPRGHIFAYGRRQGVKVLPIFLYTYRLFKVPVNNRNKNPCPPETQPLVH